MQLSAPGSRRARHARARAGAGIGLGVCLLLGLLALLPSSAGAQRRVEVYKAKHRTAEELVPLVETVLAEKGSVTVDGGTNSLVLIGDAGAIADALSLLATQDRALRSVLLRYDTRRVRELATQGYTVNWTASTGAYRLGSIRIAPDPGSAIRVQASAVVQRLVDSFSGTMRVSEGATTRIETGTMVPYATHGPSGASTEFVNATTGFEAKARILSDGRVQVDLEAFARQLRLDRSLDSMAGSTNVIVKPGVLVAVGSASEVGRLDRTNSLEGTRSDRLGDEIVLLLMANIE